MKKRILNFITKTNDLDLIKNKIIELHPADLSSYFKYFEKDQRNKIYNALEIHELALLFSYFDNPHTYLKDLDISKISKILNAMEIDDASSILNSINDEELKEQYLINLSDERQLELKYISTVDEDRVGRIISKNYISAQATWDVKKAMKVLITQADKAEVIDPIFVLEDTKLVGVLNLNDLIIARSPKSINDIMDTNIIAITINDPITDATRNIRNYSLNALPVLDDGNLVGIITSDDAFEIYTEHADAKYANLAGVSSDDLSNKSFLKKLIERLPWLFILLAFSIITSNLMVGYESIIQQVTILVFFQTLIMDMGGNVGTQSLAVTIQTLVQNNNMTRQDINKHLLKEIKINLINVVFLIAIAFCTCYLFLNIYKTNHPNYLIALIISISMGIAIIISSFLGAILPIILKKLKINPAAGSGPLITTINDIVSILIYFNIASLLLDLTI